MFETLGHYKILGRVGAGGLGEFFRGRDAPRGRTVTIELVPASIAADPDRRAGFVREASMSRVLSHPNIAALHEIVDAPGHLLLVFDVAPIQTLQAAIGAQPMNVRRALDIGIEIADALAEAHAHAILHRFLKPASVILTPQGTAKVLDFGLVAWLRDDAIRRDTISYMSPEQQRGDVLDERTDIFSLGVVLFEMLTGTPPAATKQAPLGSVDGILRKMLAENREVRYQSAAAVASDLREVAALLEARRAAGERGVI